MMQHHILNMTLWDHKIKYPSLSLSHRMGLIVFPYVTSKDFSGAKLNDEWKLLYKSLYPLGFFGYKQQILSNLSKREFIGTHWITL